MTRHGDLPSTPEEAEAYALSDDPSLGLVHVDMTAWIAAHPCECEAGCECGSSIEQLESEPGWC